MINKVFVIVILNYHCYYTLITMLLTIFDSIAPMMFYILLSDRHTYKFDANKALLQNYKVLLYCSMSVSVPYLIRYDYLGMIRRPPWFTAYPPPVMAAELIPRTAREPRVARYSMPQLSTTVLSASFNDSKVCARLKLVYCICTICILSKIL